MYLACIFGQAFASDSIRLPAFRQASPRDRHTYIYGAPSVLDARVVNQEGMAAHLTTRGSRQQVIS